MAEPVRYAQFSRFLQHTGRRAVELGTGVGSATNATGGKTARQVCCTGEGRPILPSRLLPGTIKMTAAGIEPTPHDYQPDTPTTALHTTFPASIANNINVQFLKETK